MGNIISEGLEYIGSIDDNGYVFDEGNRCIAKVNANGYISQLAGGKIYGKIDTDGTIRDASLKVIGRIQADGYVYIHSKRVCRISSQFIDKITPDAWNAGQPSSYGGRNKTPKHSKSKDVSSGSNSFFASPFFIKLVIGLVLGIVAIANGWGGAELLLICPIVVLLLSFFYKIFS